MNPHRIHLHSISLSKIIICKRTKLQMIILIKMDFAGPDAKDSIVYTFVGFSAFSTLLFV